MREHGSVPSWAGYDYTTPDGKDLVEFHVDDCVSFSKLLNETEESGGERSKLFINASTTIIDQWAEDGMFVDKNVPSKSVYEYLSLTGVKMTEVHALHFKDDVTTKKKLKIAMLNHGLFFHSSVQAALVVFGQDEAIFKQYTLMLKIWLGRGGNQPLRPKDDGLVLIISAFKYRDFGFGFELSKEQLEK